MNSAPKATTTSKASSKTLSKTAKLAKANAKATGATQKAADAADVANSVVSGLHDALTPSQVTLPADLFAEGRPQLRRAR